MRTRAPQDQRLGLWVGFFLLGIGGCAPPLIPPGPGDPSELRAVRDEYARLVREAKHDPVVKWRSGWTGNIFVNQFGGENRGLCYQWQEYIYLGLLPTVQRVGWRATGLTVNEGGGWEHHCVIIWDPKRISEDQILGTPSPHPVYALDAWHDGQPDIHWMDDWLSSQLPHRSPPRLQGLPVPMEPLPTPGPWTKPPPNAATIKNRRSRSSGELVAGG